MRVFIRTSGWAIWATRMARPVLPLVLLAIALHYVGVLASSVFVACIILAIALALFSFILGLIGYISLWYSGDAGWRESTSGLLVGTVAIVFLMFMAVMSSQFPNINDVSTAPLITPIQGRANGADAPVATLIDGQKYRFAGTRQYRLDEQTALDLISQAASNMGWSKLNQTQTSAAELHQFYKAKSLLGFVDDVTISTRTTAQLVIVNVRSASRYGSGDYGANSARIENFLLTLDELVASTPERQIAD